jgi:hypothetical protein
LQSDLAKVPLITICRCACASISIMLSRCGGWSRTGEKRVNVTLPFKNTAKVRIAFHREPKCLFPRLRFTLAFISMLRRAKLHAQFATAFGSFFETQEAATCVPPALAKSNLETMQ